MCEYSERLIAWLDRELPEREATDVEWHVGQCAECRRAVSAYEEISGAFLACYEAQMLRRPGLGSWRWAALAGGIAATILVAFVLTRPRLEQLPAPPSVMQAPAIAFEKTRVFEEAPGKIVVVRERRATAPQPIRKPWMAVEPTVQVALPAEALFPPGAVPPGFSFIADVRP